MNTFEFPDYKNTVHMQVETTNINILYLLLNILEICKGAQTRSSCLSFTKAISRNYPNKIIRNI